MPYDLKNPLVIGISSRALFDLEAENRIFEEQGLSAYEDYQVLHEKDILPKGPAFPLVEAFLQLNSLDSSRLVEVIVMSRNSPNTSLRIFNSIEHYGLDITRAALSGGAPIAPYLEPYETDLFLSAHRSDVQDAIDSGIAAGRILTGTPLDRGPSGQIRIAFDGDADRLIAVDERGHLVNGDKVMAVLALSLRQQGRLRGNTVVATVMSNMGLDIAMKKQGINLEKTVVGDRYVLEKMLEEGYVLCTVSLIVALHCLLQILLAAFCLVGRDVLIVYEVCCDAYVYNSLVSPFHTDNAIA